MGLYAVDDSYSLATWYENNGFFDLNTGTDLQLDLTRQILASDNYICQLVAFPKGPDVLVPLGTSFSGSLNLIPYTYVIGLIGFDTGQFTVRIYDKGAQTDLYYGQFAWFPTVTGVGQNTVSQQGQSVLPGNSGFDQPFGAYFFRAPWIVLPPGVLQIQITNVSQAPNPFFPQELQMLFLLAVPKNTVTLNNRRVVTSTDQSGLQSLGALATQLLEGN